MYLRQNKHQEAISLCEAALANVERNFGTAHPHYGMFAASLQEARDARDGN